VTPPEEIAAGPILLRRWRAEDAPALNLAILDSFEHLHPWMPWAAERPSLEQTEEVIAKPGDDFLYGMFSDGEVAGGCGLHWRRGLNVLEIGYWVALRHARKGYARAAAGALTEAALALPGIERVEIRCDEANEASAAVPRSLGYRLDRVEPDAVLAPAETGRSMVWVKERLPPGDRGLSNP
jgi:RimJ/RimL family protein N-acetyltransferase